MKGRSNIKSGTFETRVDIRIMATLCQFYIDNGEPPLSLADLQRKALEDYVIVLESNKMTKRIGSTLEAKRLLESMVGRATTSRGERALLRRIQIEADARRWAEIQPTADVEDIKFGERPDKE